MKKLLIFLAIIGEAYTNIKVRNGMLAEQEVKTKKRSTIEYVRLARLFLKAQMKKRKERAQEKHCRPNATSTRRARVADRIKDADELR